MKRMFTAKLSQSKGGSYSHSLDWMCGLWLTSNLMSDIKLSVHSNHLQHEGLKFTSYPTHFANTCVELNST